MAKDCRVKWLDKEIKKTEQKLMVLKASRREVLETVESCSGCEYESKGIGEYPCSVCRNSHDNKYEPKEEEDASI